MLFLSVFSGLSMAFCKADKILVSAFAEAALSCLEVEDLERRARRLLYSQVIPRRGRNIESVFVKLMVV